MCPLSRAWPWSTAPFWKYKRSQQTKAQSQFWVYYHPRCISAIYIPGEQVIVAMDGWVVLHHYDFTDQNILDLSLVLYEMNRTVVNELCFYSERTRSNIKWYISVAAMIKVTTAMFHRKTRQVINLCFNVLEIDVQYDEAVEKIRDSIKRYTARGSGSFVCRVKVFDFDIAVITRFTEQICSSPPQLQLLIMGPLLI